MSRFQYLSVRPLSGGLGAEVSGVDLSEPVSDEVFAEILIAFHAHLVLFFRAQALSREHLKAFSRRFGPLFRQPNIEAMADDPDVVAVLKEADETRISTFGGTWHSDLSYLEAPPMASVLYAVEVPPHGGDTVWANQYLAYDTLSGGFKRTLDGLACVQVGAPHGVAHAPPANLALSRSIRLVRGDPEADRERLHPTVRTHPRTGRKALFVNSVYSLRFEDMSVKESAPTSSITPRGPNSAAGFPGAGVTSRCGTTAAPSTSRSTTTMDFAASCTGRPSPAAGRVSSAVPAPAHIVPLVKTGRAIICGVAEVVHDGLLENRELGSAPAEQPTQ